MRTTIAFTEPTWDVLIGALAAGPAAFVLATSLAAPNDHGDLTVLGTALEAVSETPDHGVTVAFTTPVGAGHLCLSQSGGRISLTGEVGGRPVDAVRVVGDRLRLFLADGTDVRYDNSVFDRQVRAFGPDGQAVLSALHVGVVGGGGTGSATFEQLVRLGVGTITVIDDDAVTTSNVTRIYGSVLDDAGDLKVDVHARHAGRIGLGTAVRSIPAKITAEAAARELRHCDVVFGCTDDNSGRLILSRLAYWYLVTVIDVGVLLTSDNSGTVTDINGRITVAVPGAACMDCRGRIDHDLARIEGLDPAEREALAAEGYAPRLGTRDPAVIAYTTAVAALGVAEMLARLNGIGAAANEQVVFFHNRRIGTNAGEPRPGHYCTKPTSIGAGDVTPFLDVMWTR